MRELIVEPVELTQAIIVDTFPDVIKGDTGLTPDIQIGTVTTLEANQNATVEKVGTLEKPVFNFGIPKGERGPAASDYATLVNKPKIENVELSGNKTLQDLGIQEMSNQEILEIANRTLFMKG